MKRPEIIANTPINNSRNTDAAYNGRYEEYEDAADYIDIRAVLKGRVIA